MVTPYNLFLFACVLINFLVPTTSQAQNDLLPSDHFITITHRRDLLIAAIRNRDLSKVKLIIQTVPPLVHERYKHGVTPLHWAARQENIAIVRYLLDQGAEVNAATNNGITPLHEVATNNKIAIAALLLDRGADINAKDKNGQPVIQFALAKHHHKMVEFLQAKGAHW